MRNILLFIMLLDELGMLCYHQWWIYQVYQNAINVFNGFNVYYFKLKSN